MAWPVRKGGSKEECDLLGRGGLFRCFFQDRGGEKRRDRGQPQGGSMAGAVSERYMGRFEAMNGNGMSSLFMRT
jgi:hypothetical protein